MLAVQGTSTEEERQMGSYDKMPDDYDGPAPQHVIWCDSRWSHQSLRHTHPAVELVKLCYAAAADEAKGTEVWPCSWMLEGRGEDGPYTYECMLPARYTDQRGSYECDGGHHHVPAELRAEQNWDYAGDLEEATGMMRDSGLLPVRPDGKAWF
jgi:hypothetical protein